MVTKGNTKVLINFKALHIFDLDNCGNLGAEEVIEDYWCMICLISLQGSQLGQDIILNLTDSFVKTVAFVPSNRIDRNTAGDFKDIITRSIISREDIKSFDLLRDHNPHTFGAKLKEQKIRQPNGRNLKIQHSFRHTTKNTFCFNVVDDLDQRIVLHE